MAPCVGTEVPPQCTRRARRKPCWRRPSLRAAMRDKMGAFRWAHCGRTGALRSRHSGTRELAAKPLWAVDCHAARAMRKWSFRDGAMRRTGSSSHRPDASSAA
ncbi:hypothetical protein SB85_09255 [Xanthomonas sacchari]|nr:hypothetical protein SB85_09255 [Xanthomonas sacchari]